jgi:hypothetical protein
MAENLKGILVILINPQMGQPGGSFKVKPKKDIYSTKRLALRFKSESRFP